MSAAETGEEEGARDARRAVLLRGQRVDARGVRADLLLYQRGLRRRGARSQVMQQRGGFVREDVDAQVTAVVAARRARHAGAFLLQSLDLGVDDTVQPPAYRGASRAVAARPQRGGRVLERGRGGGRRLLA